MNLTPAEADRFFRLMLPLQAYAAQELQILPGQHSLNDYQALPKAQKAEVRDGLHAHPELIDRFVAENPAELTTDDLALVASWKLRRAGQFVIVSLLKRYAIFVSAADTDEVFAVLGLRDALAEVLYPIGPPVLVRAVLLPFAGRIIYDGFLEPSMLLGPGIGADVRATYQRARRRGTIRFTLEEPPPPAPSRPRAAPADLAPRLEALLKEAEALKAPGLPLHQHALALLRASARLANATALDPNDLDALEKLSGRLNTAHRAFLTELHRWFDN